MFYNMLLLQGKWKSSLQHVGATRQMEKILQQSAATRHIEKYILQRVYATREME